MGRAQIVSEIGEGRYTIELDYGEATRQAILAAFAQMIPRLALSVEQSQALVDEAEEKETVARQNAQNLFDAVAALPPDQRAPAIAAYNFALTFLVKLISENQKLRAQLQAFKDAYADAVKREAHWRDEVVCTETRDAWCTTYTVGAATGYVATIEIPGETELILIAPNARNPIDSADGVMTSRDVQSPWQAFWNAAVLPGWQKWLPMYRYGEITDIDWDAATCSISLSSATSSAQGLDVNQSSSLEDVPFQYGTCGAHGFGIGDNVVVEFTNFDWGSPKVIGYVDNPRACPPKKTNSIPYQSACAGLDELPGFNIGAFFSAGHGQRSFEVIEGALPLGVSLDPDAGILAGKPTAGVGNATYTVKIRCSDEYYEENVNRRYDDSNQFEIEVIDELKIERNVSVDHVSGLFAFEGNTDYRYSLSIDSPNFEGATYYATSSMTRLGSATPFYVSGSFSTVWLRKPLENECLFGRTWFHRVRYTGDPYVWSLDDGIPIYYRQGLDYGSQETGEWAPGFLIVFYWSMRGYSVGVPQTVYRGGSFAIDFAQGEASEENIVFTVSGSFTMQMLLVD